jgi:hypothetical protein
VTLKVKFAAFEIISRSQPVTGSVCSREDWNACRWPSPESDADATAELDGESFA